MRELDLHTAVDEIVVAVEGARPRGLSPYFFIVGAGISSPPIPLASGIEQRCRARIDELSRPIPTFDSSSSPLDRYEQCFERAYPHAHERRDFLHGLVHEAQISAANLRLAHLLSEGELTKLVVTPNFDEMLSRALRLLGHDVITCDHPSTTERIDRWRQDVVQVIHVHGTHWFYDACNLRGEIKDQAKRDVAGAASMRQLLDLILAERSPLVVGYSGWKDDVLMTALLSQLRQPRLRFNLYWFCFQRSDIGELPEELVQHRSVRFVVPPQWPSLGRMDLGDRPGSPIGAIADDLTNDDRSNQSKLPAREVFEAFIQRQKLQAPRLTAEPLGFFLDQLRANLDPIEASGQFFLIGQILRRVQTGMDFERDGWTKASPEQQQAAQALGSLSDAVRRSAYPAAVEAARTIDLSVLDLEQKKELGEAMNAASEGLRTSSSANAALYLELCDIWKELAEVALGHTPSTLTWSIAAGKALNGRALALWKLCRLEEAAAAYSEVIERFGDAREPELRERVAIALLYRGTAFEQLGRPEHGLESYLDLIHRFGSAQDTALWVARALLRRGYALQRAGRQEDALESFRDVGTRFHDGAPELRVCLAEALVAQGDVLRSGGDPKAALAPYITAIERFGDFPESDLRMQVARARLQRANALLASGHREAALEAYSQLLDRLGAPSERALEYIVALALLGKGRVLWLSGMPDKAIEPLSEVVRRFEASPHPEIRTTVVWAFINKGSILSATGIPDAITAFAEADRRSAEFTEPGMQEAGAFALEAKVDALLLLGQGDKALEDCSEIVQRFGDSQDLAMRERVANALLTKGEILARAEKLEDAITSYSELERRVGAAPEVSLQALVARALVGQGSALERLERSDAALEVWDSVIQRFGDVEQPELNLPVARALIGRAVILDEMDRSEDALKASTQVIERFGKSSEPALRELAAVALLHQGVIFGNTGDLDAGLEMFAQVINLLADSTTQRGLSLTAEALVKQGMFLDQAGKSDAALQAYSQVVQRFGEAAEPDVQRSVAEALVGWADLLAEQGDNEPALELYAQVVQRFADLLHPEVQELVAHAREKLTQAKTESDRVE